MSLSLIDRVNEAFIQVGINQSSRDYRKYFSSVTQQVNAIIKKNGSITQKEVKQIVQDNTISNRGFEKSVLLFMLLGAATYKLFKSKKSDYTQRRLKKISQVFKMYKPNRPITFTKKMNELTNLYVNGGEPKLKGKQKKAFELIKEYFDANKNTIKRIMKTTEKDRLKMNKLVQRNLSRNIFGTYEDLIKKQTSLKSIESQLTKKYKDSYRVKRILDTETHALSESVKLVNASAVGFTHKTWRTQGDSRVRDLPNSNHKVMNRVRIAIEDKFNLQGELADAPGDINLSASQRIGCRCYATYD